VPIRTVSRFIRQLLRQRGVEISRYTWPRRVATIDPDVVLDVGANIGQYAAELRAGGYRNQIVSFEPLASAHAELSRRSAADERWQVAPRMALGDTETETEINVAGNSFSSSLLSMLDTHREAAPQAAFMGREKVRVRRLDSVAGDYVRPAQRYLLKLDVQGYESKVLDGAPETLSRAAAVQFEASLASLYQGEALFPELLERMLAAGFDLWSVSPEFTDLRTGRVLQVDCFFVRT
jgi:FkbM family methyltransferase